LSSEDLIRQISIVQPSRAMGIRVTSIVPASPWQNGFAEQLIGSIRRECYHRVVTMKEALASGFISVEIICLSTTEMIWWLCWLILHIATITP